MIYQNIQASLFYLTKVYKDGALSVSPGLKGFKFDAWAEEEELPNTDLIGPSNVILEDDGSLLRISCQFNICTFNDENIMRLDELIDGLYDVLRPSNVFNYIDHKTAVPSHTLKVGEKVTIFPIARVRNRALKSIAVQLFTDLRANRTPTGPSLWDGSATWDQAILWD